MKIYIELLIPIIAALMFLFWFLWLKATKLFHRWRYNEKKDRGKIGEEHRQELIRRGLSDPSRTIGKTIDNIDGQGISERRNDIPTADVDVVGEDNSGSGKSRRRRKLFRRR